MTITNVKNHPPPQKKTKTKTKNKIKNRPLRPLCYFVQVECYILSKLPGMKNFWLKSKLRHEASFSITHPDVQWMCTSGGPLHVCTSGGPLHVCNHWATWCLHYISFALQPHASIRVPTSSATSGGPLDVATSGGPLDVATSGGPPVGHWW